MNANRFMYLSMALAYPTAAQTQFTVTTLDGRTQAGVCDSWRVGELLSLRAIERPKASDPPTAQALQPTIPDCDIDVVTLEPRSPATFVGAWHLDLIDGSRISGEVAGGDEEHLLIRHTELGELRIRIEAIERLGSTTAAIGEWPANADEDLVLLSGGSRVAGAVSACSASGLTLTVDGKMQRIPWTTIAGVIPARLTKATPASICAVVQMTDGGRISAATLEWNGSRFKVESALLGSRTIGPDAVCVVERISGRRVWLSDQTPKQIVATPYLGKSWPMRCDESVMGTPLIVSGRRFSRGLGLHSGTKATWDLGGRFKLFRCTAGIDDSAGRLADADLQISCDGRVMLERKGLTRGAEPSTIELDVAGAKELTIEIGFGKNGHVQDRVDLVNAALIADRPAPR